MEKILNKLIQTGYNLERLKEDGKIDSEAYAILNDRNIQTITLVESLITMLNELFDLDTPN